MTENSSDLQKSMCHYWFCPLLCDSISSGIILDWEKTCRYFSCLLQYNFLWTICDKKETFEGHLAHWIQKWHQWWTKLFCIVIWILKFEQAQFSIYVDFVQNQQFTFITFLLSLRSFCIQRWSDEYLTWEPEEYGNMTVIKLPQHQIWTPDLMLYNT